jgi:hypothetical protein
MVGKTIRCVHQLLKCKYLLSTTKYEGGLYGGSTLKTNKEVLETKYTIKLTNFYKNSSRTERIK